MPIRAVLLADHGLRCTFTDLYHHTIPQPLPSYPQPCPPSFKLLEAVLLHKGCTQAAVVLDLLCRPTREVVVAGVGAVACSWVGLA